MMEALNHSRMWSLISSATRRARPDLSTMAEREMEKFMSSAMRRTLVRVAFDTSSGRVNARDTVEADTPACSATSLMLNPMRAPSCHR